MQEHNSYEVYSCFTNDIIYYLNIYKFNMYIDVNIITTP